MFKEKRDKLKDHWKKFSKLPPGERFETRYREKQKERANKPGWHGVLSIAAGVGCLAIGVVLMFIPGPAVLFFLAGAGLFAGESRWIARGLDKTEVKLRAWGSAAKSFWQRSSAVGRVPVVLAALLVVGGVGFAAVAMILRFSR